MAPRRGSPTVMSARYHPLRQSPMKGVSRLRPFPSTLRPKRMGCGGRSSGAQAGKTKIKKQQKGKRLRFSNPCSSDNSSSSSCSSSSSSSSLRSSRAFVGSFFTAASTAAAAAAKAAILVPHCREITWEEIEGLPQEFATESSGQGALPYTPDAGETLFAHFHHPGEVEEKVDYYYTQVAQDVVGFNQRVVDELRSNPAPPYPPNKGFFRRISTKLSSWAPFSSSQTLHSLKNPCPALPCQCCFCPKCAKAGVSSHASALTRVLPPQAPPRPPKTSTSSSSQKACSAAPKTQQGPSCRHREPSSQPKVGRQAPPHCYSPSRAVGPPPPPSSPSVATLSSSTPMTRRSSFPSRRGGPPPLSSDKEPETKAAKIASKLLLPKKRPREEEELDEESGKEDKQGSLSHKRTRAGSRCLVPAEKKQGGSCGRKPNSPICRFHLRRRSPLRRLLFS